MGITEEVKQTRKQGSDRKNRSIADHSSANGTVAGVKNVEGQDKVDQVRDLLFGAQREEYDRRFNRLEELLVRSTSDLSNDTAKKFSTIKDEYDRRLSRLEELLVKNISDLSNDTAKKLGAVKDENDRRFARLEELLVKNISDLNNDTAKKFSATRDEYNKLLAGNMTNLRRELQELRQGKVDKEAISKLLEEILKLSKDLNVA